MLDVSSQKKAGCMETNPRWFSPAACLQFNSNPLHVDHSWSGGQVGGLDEEQAALLAFSLEKHVKGGERQGRAQNLLLACSIPSWS